MKAEPNRRVEYSTWNLVAVAFFGVVTLGDTAPALADQPGHPLLWALCAVIATSLVWAVRERGRRPSWLLPRFYVLVAVPAWLALPLLGDLTAFGLGAIWLIIVPATLSGNWLDRLFGAPPTKIETSV